ncbi:Leucine-rich repeat receptor protein kinase ems1 [Thalictrum thalictroides]|uniref:Leucine-rich repeat receptor protein kinase ems1 n=1 Tax=Thalictrum thalictroides TaxID=46969 RepID=A0A7J6VST6_THATH|nr:Leucine-rich repeat receptor protein kinase ems1 [Thalictrum thalictroides]
MTNSSSFSSVPQCLTRNYLKEWGSLPIVNISLIGNRITGRISIKLDLQEFVSGVLPSELGNMVSIERILISSNNFTGPLPETLAKLTTLKDFRISDNHFTGTIPNFLQNWTNLEKMAVQASGLEGPIPSGISLLTKLSDLRLSDIKATGAAFPPLSNMTKMKTPVLRSSNITGAVPSYLGDMASLKTLDLRFNKLTGPIPSSFGRLSSDFIYLTGNALTGPVPDWMLKSGDYVAGVTPCFRSVKCQSMISFFLFEEEGIVVSIGNLGWPLANTVIFGVLLSENYSDDKFATSKDFQREFILIFPEVSLCGLMFCGLLLGISVRELDHISSKYPEIGFDLQIHFIR